VSLRGSFDGFAPHPMARIQRTPGVSGPGDEFELWRMVPPGEVLYSFVVSSPEAAKKRAPDARASRARRASTARADVECVAEDQATAPLRGRGTAELRQCLRAAGLGDAVNAVRLEPRRDDVDVQIVSPREVQAHDKLPPKRKVTLAPWSLATSSFAPYRVDTASSIKAAFEVDYGLTNLSKLLGSPNAAAEDRAKLVLKESYEFLKLAFKHYAMASTEVFAVGWNAYTDFVISCNLPDPQRLSRADVDMAFFSSSTIGPPGPRNPKKSLCRFQFLDASVRLAMKRYYASGDVEEPADAIQKLLTNIEAIPSIETLKDVGDLHDRIWRRETDDVVKKHLDLLKKVYDKWSGANNLPGQPRSASARGTGATFPTSKAPISAVILLASADFWTSDHLSARSRRADAFFRNARAGHTRVEATSHLSFPGQVHVDRRVERARRPVGPHRHGEGLQRAREQAGLRPRHHVRGQRDGDGQAPGREPRRAPRGTRTASRVYSRPNFGTLERGHIDVDAADCWTHRSLSSSARSAAEDLASKRYAPVEVGRKTRVPRRSSSSRRSSASRTSSTRRPTGRRPSGRCSRT